MKINIAFCPFLLSSASIISDHHKAKGIKEKVFVDTITIDSFVKERNLGDVDLIIANVETAEPLVLNGMRETIQKSQPTFIIEVHPDKKIENFYKFFFIHMDISSTG